MFLTVKLRDALPLMAALMLIAATFLLPPYELDEPAAAAFSASEHILIIDAGHGGADGGAVAADGTLESGINLAVAKKLEALSGLFAVRTLMTRSDEELDYPEGADSIAEMKRADQNARVCLINSVQNGVLISIHQNYYPDSRPSGAQALYSASEGSRELGELVHELLVENLSPGNRRVAAPADEDIYLMRSARCPAVLVECGFISNPGELEKLKTDEYQTELAAVLLTAYLQCEPASGVVKV